MRSQLSEIIQFDDEYLQQSFLTNLNNQINGVINGDVGVNFALNEFKKIKEILDEVIDDLGQLLTSEVTKKNAQIEELRQKTTEADQEKAKKEEELTALIERLEAMSSSEIGSTHA